MYLEYLFCDGLNAQYSFILSITKKIFTWPLLKHPFLLFISVVPFCDVWNNLTHHLNRKTRWVFEATRAVRYHHLDAEGLHLVINGQNSLSMGFRGGSLSQVTVEKEKMLRLCPHSLRYSSLAKRAHCILGPSGTAIVPLCSAVAPPHVLCAALGASVWERHQTLLGVLRRVTKTVEGHEDKAYKEQLRSLVLFSLEKGRLWGDLITALRFLKGSSGGGAGLSSFLWWQL